MNNFYKYFMSHIDVLIPKMGPTSMIGKSINNLPFNLHNFATRNTRPGTSGKRIYGRSHVVRSRRMGGY